MVKSLCHLPMKVIHVIVENFYVANMSFNTNHENKIYAKISVFTVINKLHVTWICRNILLPNSVSII